MQQRLRDYQSQLGSYLHNLINLGIHKPGRFCGYDTLVGTGALQFSLTHAASGINTFNAAGNPYGPLGVAMTVQGEVIIEDAPIAGLTITPNASTTLWRTDLVIMTHQYLQIAGGGAAVYSIVPGVAGPQTVGNPTPNLSPFQVMIGWVIVPPQTTNISQCTYTKNPCPDSGDSPDAKLSVPNVYSVINANAIDQQGIIAPTLVDANGNNLYMLSGKGNTYFFNPSAQINIDGLGVAGIPNQGGIEINIILNRYCTVRTGMPTVGQNPIYVPITVSVDLCNGVYALPDGTIIDTYTPPPNDGSQIVLSLVHFMGTWVIKSMSGPGYIPTGGVPPGE